jgi:hypothetical protein
LRIGRELLRVHAIIRGSRNLKSTIGRFCVAPFGSNAT